MGLKHSGGWTASYDYTFIKILKFIRVCNTKRQEYEVTYPHVNAKKIMIHIDFETQKSEFKKVSLFKALLISNKIRKMPISEIGNYLKKLSMGQCCSWGDRMDLKSITLETS